MDAEYVLPAAISATPLMICGICHKPFTRDLQYKRHVAYCRKAKPRKRPRSCRSCNLAKIKCNSEEPCHQCTRKGIKFVFEGQSRDRDVGREEEGAKDAVAPTTTGDTDVVTAALTNSVDPRSISSGGTLKDLMAFEPEIYGSLDGTTSNHETTFYASQYQPQLSDVPQLLETMSLGPFATTCFTRSEENISQTLPHKTFNSSIGTFNFQFDDSSLFIGQELQRASSSSSSSSQQIIPTAETTASSSAWNQISHFSKNFRSGIQQICLTMIIEMLCAYPRMMTRRETFPPFIHSFSPFTATDNGENKLPEHIASCMGIAQLFVIRNDDTRSFIWATIRAEMIGFRNGMHGFTKYDTLSALQASLVYIMIRAVENVPQDAENDSELLCIYNDLVIFIIEQTDPNCGSADVGQIKCWKDWIFMESIRRVACLWFILGRAFHMRTGKWCFVQEHFRELSLPCPKREWEAESELEWEREQNTKLGMRENSGTIQTIGDLLDTHQQPHNTQTIEKLSVWNAGIDLLCMILNLAIRIV